uniref:Fungal_trans domain-containing protein n=1 Tax=Macrostomum lignano TaxID=282301 RepID=A0A1I8F668_9PLAT
LEFNLHSVIEQNAPVNESLIDLRCEQTTGELELETVASATQCRHTIAAGCPRMEPQQAAKEGGRVFRIAAIATLEHRHQLRPFQRAPHASAEIFTLARALRRLMKKRHCSRHRHGDARNAPVQSIVVAAASQRQSIRGGLSNVPPDEVVCPNNCNLALLRRAQSGRHSAIATGVNPPYRQTHWTSVLVDAIEALAKALTDSLTQPGFRGEQRVMLSPAAVVVCALKCSAMSCLYRASHVDASPVRFPTTRQQDSSTLSGVEDRCVIYCSSSVRADAVGSASGSLTKLFHKSGAEFVFPNTFTARFNNATIMICAPTVYLKRPSDGQRALPLQARHFSLACIGELQQDIVSLGAGLFTKTTVRDAVIDYSAALFAEYHAILPTICNSSTRSVTEISYFEYLWCVTWLFHAQRPGLLSVRHDRQEFSLAFCPFFFQADCTRSHTRAPAPHTVDEVVRLCASTAKLEACFLDAPNCPYEVRSRLIQLWKLVALALSWRRFPDAFPLPGSNCKKAYVADDLFNAATVAFTYPEDAIYGLGGGLLRKAIVTRAYTGAESIGLDTVAGCFVVTGCFFAVASAVLLAG